MSNFSNVSIEYVWILRGLSSGKAVDAWWGTGEHGYACTVTTDDIEFYSDELGEPVVICLEYAILENGSNLLKYFLFKNFSFKTKGEAENALDIILNNLV